MADASVKTRSDDKPSNLGTADDPFADASVTRRASEQQTGDPFAGAVVVGNVRDRQEKDPFADAVLVKSATERGNERTSLDIEALRETGFQETAPDGEPQTSAAAARATSGSGLNIEALEETGFRRTDQPSDTGTAITSSMWDGVPFDEAMRRYGELLDDPNVSRPVGGLGYAVFKDPRTGQTEYIPAPEPDRTAGIKDAIGDIWRGITSDDISMRDAVGASVSSLLNPPSATSNTTNAILGTTEAAGDAVTAIASVADNVYGTNLTDNVEKATPNYDTEDSGWDALVADGVPAILGAVAGGGAVNAAARARNVGNVARKLGTVLGGEAGATASIGTDEGTLLTGPNAMLPVLDGVDLGDERSDEVLEHRINTLTEGLLAGSVVAGTARIARPITTAAKWAFAPITSLFAKDGIEKRVYEEISRELAGIGSETTPEQAKAARDRVAEVVQENQDVVFRMLDKLEQEDKAVLDTVSSLIRGADSRDEVSRLENLGQSYLGGEYNNFRTASQNPQIALEEQLSRQARALGGETPVAQNATMGRAADQLAGSGRLGVAVAETNAQSAQDQYDHLTTNFLEEVRDDPIFGSKVSDLERKTGTEIVGPRVQKLEDVKRGLRDSYEYLKSEKDQRYAAISGGEIDPEAVANAFDRIAKADVLSTTQFASGKFPINEFLKQTRRRPKLDANGKRITEDGKAVMESDAERGDRFGKWLNKNGVDFGRFYREIRPTLSAVANDLFQSNKSAAGGAVRDLVKFIDNDMVEQVAKSDPALAEKAREAKRFYREEFAPVFGPEAGNMHRYAEIYESTIGRFGTGEAHSGAVDGSGAALGTFAGDTPLGYEEGTQRLANSILGGMDEVEVASLSKALASASNPDNVADYLILDLVEEFGAEASARGLQNVDLSSLGRDVRSRAAALRRTFPEKAARLDGFIGRVQDAAAKGEDLKRTIETARRKAEVRKQEILQGELAPFFRDKGMQTTSNPEEAFDQLFKGKEAIGNLEDLDKRIEGMPEANQRIVRNGLRTAYSRHLRDTMFSRTRQSGNVMPTANRNIDRAEDGETNLYEIGDMLFEDQPEVMETVRTLANVAKEMSSSRGAKPVANWSPTAFQQDAMASTNRVISLLIGPLSRTATRARAGASALVETRRSQQKAIGIIDRILANPDEFVRLTRKYNKDPSNPENANALAYWVGSTTPKIVGGDNGDYATGDETARMLREATRQGEYGRNPEAEWLQ